MIPSFLGFHYKFCMFFLLIASSGIYFLNKHTIGFPRRITPPVPSHIIDMDVQKYVQILMIFLLRWSLWTVYNDVNLFLILLLIVQTEWNNMYFIKRFKDCH